MTKKELLDSQAFKAMPDDAEIVFNTSSRVDLCKRLRLDQMTLIQQVVNVDDFKDIPLNIRGSYVFRPQYATALVIEAVPYDYLEHNGIHLRKDGMVCTK